MLRLDGDKALETSIHRWREINIHELAELASVTLSTDDRDDTIVRLENWLDRLEFDTAPVIVQTHSSGELVGWLLLFIHNDTRVEINPWALNGHPFVSPHKNFEKVASELIKQAILQADREGMTRIELSFRRTGEPCERYKRLYRSLGLRLMTETVIMRCVLADFDFEKVEFPFVVKPLTEVGENELYQLYYQTFKSGQDRFFLEQTEEERRVFFDQTFSRSEPLNEETSLVAVKDERNIGFSLVRPTHGEGNCHLWMFGIHPEYRRRGVGRSLLQLIMKTAQRKYRTMSLACEVSNLHALKLYQSQGFKEEFSKIEYSMKMGET